MGILKKRCWYPFEIRTFNFIIEILLMPKKCEYKSDNKRYVPFLLGNKLGVDQVPGIEPKRLHIRNKAPRTYFSSGVQKKILKNDKIPCNLQFAYKEILPSASEGMRLSKQFKR